MKETKVCYHIRPEPEGRHISTRAPTLAQYIHRYSLVLLKNTCSLLENNKENAVRFHDEKAESMVNNIRRSEKKGILLLKVRGCNRYIFLGL